MYIYAKLSHNKISNLLQQETFDYVVKSALSRSGFYLLHTEKIYLKYLQYLAQ